MKKILIFTAGVVLGSGVTYYIVDKKTREKYDELSREYREILHGQTMEKYGIPDEEEVVEDGDYVFVSEDEEVSWVDTLSTVEHPVEYEDEIEEIIANRGTEEDVYVNTSEPKEPYILTFDEYDTASVFEKVDMTWWAGSGTLTDGDEQIVDMEIVGMDNLDRWGDSDPNDPDVLYIRNELRGIDINLYLDQRNFFEDL